MKRVFQILLMTAALLLPLQAAAQSDAAQAARVQRAMERMEAEPSILEVHRAALDYFRVNPEAVERIREKSVRRAAAPRLEIVGRYEWADSNRDIYPEATQLYTYDNAGSNVAGGGLSLSWDLPGLVFNSAELQTYALIGIQMNILKEVTRLFYVRRQLLLGLLADPPSDPRTLLAMRMRVEEFTSLIDSFTGGWFSQNIPGDD